MRPLLCKQNINRRRKIGLYQQHSAIEEELQPRPNNRKTSGGDFCSAKKARQMFKNLTELRQHGDSNNWRQQQSTATNR